jgi:glyoxylase-like metal-dependent hydrolase (beta-lactamase superfamily II)
MQNLPDFSRRDVLAGLSATGLAAVATPAFAKAPLLNTPAPGFYRFKIGAIEATVISDGPLELGAPQPELFKGMTKEEFGKALTDNFLPTDSFRLEQNALVINTGDKLVLIDTGTGGQKMFGPHSGKLLANLKAAGIDPKDIDAVALTHAHPDHCWGLLDESGAKNFPNAQVYMSEDDFNFWTDLSKAPNDMIKGFIEGTKKQLLPIRERIEFIKDGQEFITGIQAISAPGHTVGHTIFMVTSQGKQLCNTGDLAHHHVIAPEKPRVEFAFDTDGKQGAATRIKMFGMLAAQRIPIVSYHFPWPGVGHLAKQGEGFRYYPSPIQTAL